MTPSKPIVNIEVRGEGDYILSGLYLDKLFPLPPFPTLIKGKG